MLAPETRGAFLSVSESGCRALYQIGERASCAAFLCVFRQPCRQLRVMGCLRIGDLMSNSTMNDPGALPDWWQREKQQRQKRILIFLAVLLALIAYFYYISAQGRVLRVGVNFETADYVAFVRQDKDGKTQIYAVRADGTGLRQLTDKDDKSDKFAPAWTNDGKTLLYVSNRNDVKTRQIYLLGDGDPQQLTYGTGNKDTPVASPDGKHVGFVTQGAIKTVLLNGNEVYQEIPTPQAESHNEAEQQAPEPQGPFLNVGFASDGIGIAGVQALNGENVIVPNQESLGDQVVRVLPNGAKHALILSTGHEVSFAWDPTGERLACSFTEMPIKDKNTQTHLLHGINIYSFESPEKPTVKQMIGALDTSIEPKNIAWSPDGKMIAFEGWAFKGEGVRELRGLLVMPITETPVALPPGAQDQVHYMVPASAEGRPQHPRWSPDGARLLYEMARPDGNTDIWVINADGTNPINLTKGVGNNMQGAWSPAHRK